MTSPIQAIFDPYAPLPTTRDGMPIFYEDEEEGDMGESSPHSDATGILHICLMGHLASRPAYRVFANLNCYYLDGPRHPVTGSLPYVSPDIMVVRPARDLGEAVSSYTIGRDGPAPVLVIEVLSPRSAQQRDQREKLSIYARLGIREYLLADPTGQHLPERLLAKRLQRGTWGDRRDPDGGITSRLGFRVIMEADGRLSVLDSRTGQRYPRPDEAKELADKVKALEAELARLRGAAPEPTNPKRRRRKS